MEITRAKQEDIPRLRELWRDCFAADTAYCDLFFDGRFCPEESLVARESEGITAMLYRLPLRFTAGKRVLRGRYVYAVGTAPQHRGKGTSTALLEAHHCLCRADGEDLSLLVPAGPALFPFYEKRGFAPCFSRQREEVSAQDGAILFQRGSLAEQQPLRDDYFGRSALYGRWDNQALAYVQREAEIQGGCCLTFPGGYLLCRPLGEARLEIIELVPGSHPAAEVAAQAAAQLGKAYVVFPRWPFLPDEAQPYGMAAFYTDVPDCTHGLPPYFGLPLD